MGQREVGWVGSDSNDAHLVHKSLMLNCDLWFLPERLALVFKIIQTGTVWLPSGLPPPSTGWPTSVSTCAVGVAGLAGDAKNAASPPHRGEAENETFPMGRCPENPSSWVKPMIAGPRIGG